MSEYEDFLMFQSFLNSEKQERGVFATFYNKAVRTGRFLENGLPEFEHKIFIKIRILNSADEVDRPAEEADMQRFAREYAFFKTKSEKVKTGTPLNQFAFLSPSQIECCEYRNIFTVEELSALDDEKAAALGLKEEKETAEKFLEASQNNKVIYDLRQQVRFLENEIARLNEEKALIKNQTAQTLIEEK